MYELPSQQCQSESLNLYYANINNNVAVDVASSKNIMEEDLMSGIMPQGIPQFRQQKSQGTFRVQHMESDSGEMKAISQFSDDSGNKKNESYLSNRDGVISGHEEPHPFNGPKLHQFRKGQSKSSHTQSRKIIRKIKSSANNKQFDIVSSNHGRNPMQLSEATSQISKNYISKNNGLVNISEILEQQKKMG